MSLVHVYLVLEPVGSARLTFSDDRYYEFMCFDVPKVVQSPRYDHEHDEESRNGRDIKIDILEAYIWTSESFRVKSAFYRSTGRLPEPPGGLLGLHGPRGRRGKEAGGGRAPLPFLVRIGQGKGGGAPPFLRLFLLFPPFHVVGVGEKEGEERRKERGPAPSQFRLG